MGIQGCEYCMGFEHVTAWFAFIIIIIIIIAHCTCRGIRPSHCLPKSLCCMLLPWQHSSSSTQPCLSLSFDSPSPSGLWSPSHPSIFWCPLQFRKIVIHNLSMFPNQFPFLLYTSQLISLISAISATLLFVILCCQLILRIPLGNWDLKLFSFLSAVIFHVSKPYRRTGWT